MPNLVYGKNFLKSAKRLPTDIQKKLAKQAGLLKQNPFDPRLHSKYLVGELTGFLSFRVTRNWRVIFQFLDPETIQLIEAANRKNIYR